MQQYTYSTCLHVQGRQGIAYTLCVNMCNMIRVLRLTEKLAGY